MCSLRLMAPGPSTPPIWLTKAETARRVRQRTRRVFARARTAGFREAPNPVDDIEQCLPRQKDKNRHHAALPWPDRPEFMAGLDRNKGLSAKALRFTILTCGRSGGIRNALWSEIDMENAVWTIPAEKMKAGSEHRVPLTPKALAILEEVRGLHPELIFPGQKPDRPMSDMTMTKLLKRMGRMDITVHGFRSTFRDWVSEATGFSSDLAERCLAHAVGNAATRLSGDAQAHRASRKRQAQVKTAEARGINNNNNKRAPRLFLRPIARLPQPLKKGTLKQSELRLWLTAGVCGTGCEVRLQRSTS